MYSVNSRPPENIMRIAAARVDLGSAWLRQRYGESWRDRLTRPADIRSGRDCVLAQVTGLSWQQACEESGLTLPQLESAGFTVLSPPGGWMSVSSDGPRQQMLSALQDAWDRHLHRVYPPLLTATALPPHDASSIRFRRAVYSGPGSVQLTGPDYSGSVLGIPAAVPVIVSGDGDAGAWSVTLVRAGSRFTVR